MLSFKSRPASKTELLRDKEANLPLKEYIANIETTR